MWTWLNNLGGDVGALWRDNRQRWLRYRLVVADWAYAVLPLPFSGIMQLSAGSAGDVGVLNGPAAALLESPLFDHFLPMLLFGVYYYVFPVVAAGAAVLLRRSRPQWLMATGFGMLLLFGNFVPAAVALYSYAVHHADRRLLTGWFALYCLAFGLAVDTDLLAQAFLVSAILLVPLVFGLWVGTRRQLVDRLQERAERLEHERYLLAEQAIAAERTRIAREMHDVVAHRVSLMVLHAGGLEVSAEDPRTVETAGLIRTTGREALSELRGILGVLRDDSTAPPTAPQPVLADLDRLVGEWSAAGMRVVLERTGRPGDVSVRAQRTVYRIVQEGLTNAAKHAPGASAAVRVHRMPDRVEVEVANGPASAPATHAPASGFGLVGLHERVVLAGGELMAGSCPDGGWRLRAIVPTDEPDGAEEAAP